MSNKLVYIRVHKPFGILSQFTQESPEDKTLKDIAGLPPEVYPVGRLDKDSEGLLLLTNDTSYKAKTTDPKSKTWKVYLCVVEGVPTKQQLSMLETGVEIRINKKAHKTAPARIETIQEMPSYLEQGGKPIRFRKEIPVSFLKLSISEGKNRQVRRMCAAVGLPVLRLIRIQIGKVELSTLQPGQWEYFNPSAT